MVPENCPYAALSRTFRAPAESGHGIMIGFSFIYRFINSTMRPFANLTPRFRGLSPLQQNIHIHICRCHSDTKSLAWVLGRLPYNPNMCIYIYVYIIIYIYIYACIIIYYSIFIYIAIHIYITIYNNDWCYTSTHSMPSVSRGVVICPAAADCGGGAAGWSRGARWLGGGCTVPLEKSGWDTVGAGIIERKLRSTKVRLFTVPCCSIILFSSGGVKKKRIWIYS